MEYYNVDYFYLNRDTMNTKGHDALPSLLADIIYIIPKEFLDDVLSNCVFLMLDETVFPAYYVPKKIIEGKSLIVFPDNLFSKDEEGRTDMILHEIAHYVLRHSDPGIYNEAYSEQEKEANALRKKWKDDWEKYQKGGYKMSVKVRENKI
jgi:hypothetical protein